MKRAPREHSCCRRATFFRAIAWTFGAAAAFAPSAMSQGAPAADRSQPDVSKVERLNRAPVSKTVLQVKLPKPVEATLPDGIDVMILEDHRLPMVTVQFDIQGAGPLFEPSSQPGLASATAQLLRQGTAQAMPNGMNRTLSSEQIAEQIDSLGASLNANAGFGSGSTVVTASGLSDNFDQWFALATDVLLHPSFPADEVAQYKGRAGLALVQQRAQPAFLANQTLSRALYGAFPAAVVSATPESIDALTAEMLANWHASRYTPQNTILAISGDVRAETLLPKLRQWLGDWHRTDAKVEMPTAPEPATKGKVFLVDRPGSVQTTLLMGNLAIRRNDPDYPALAVMNEVLGQEPPAACSQISAKIKAIPTASTAALSRASTPVPGPPEAISTPCARRRRHDTIPLRAQSHPHGKGGRCRAGRFAHALVARFSSIAGIPRPSSSAMPLPGSRNAMPADYWDKYPAQIAAPSPMTYSASRRNSWIRPPCKVVAVGDAAKDLVRYGKIRPR